MVEALMNVIECQEAYINIINSNIYSGISDIVLIKYIFQWPIPFGIIYKTGVIINILIRLYISIHNIYTI